MEQQGDFENSLPFSDKKQHAVLGYLLINDNFFLQAFNRIKPEFFLSPYNQKIYAAKEAFYRQYNRCPTIQEIKEFPSILVEEQNIKNKIYLAIDNCINETRGIGLDTIYPELTAWLHVRLYKKAVEQSKHLYNSKKPQQAFEIIKGFSREIDQIKFEREEEVIFSNFETFFDNSQAEYENALTTGLDALDKILVPEASGCSLLRGDTTIYMAPTNGAKTTTLLTTLGHNIRKQKDILLLSHEGRKEDLTIKIWCTFLKRTKTQIFEMYKTKEGKTLMDMAVKMIERYLTYIPVNKPGVTVEEIMSIIRRKQEERIAKYGKGYDLVVDDYPAKLMLGSTNGINYQLRNAEEIVYNYFVQAALDFNFHSLLAIQTNREGSKVNKQLGGNSRLLVKEDVKETWGATNIATNIITINRSPLAAMKEFATFYVDKSRSNSTGWAVVVKTDMAKALTHSNELGCMWYKGVMTIDDRLDDLFTDYFNREIPQHLVV